MIAVGLIVVAVAPHTPVGLSRFEAIVDIPDLKSLAQISIDVRNPLGEEKAYPLLTELR